MMSENEPVKKKGMGTGLKILLGLLIGGGVMAVLCCGVGYYFFNKAFKPLTNPADIIALTDEVASIDLPEDAKPVFGLRMNVGLTMKMAAYQVGEEGQDNGQIMLMEMNIPGNNSPEQMEGQFKQQMGQQQQGGKNQIEVKEQTTRKFTIDGVERDFSFMTGTKPGTDEPMRQVQGMFAGKGGTAFLVYTTDEEHWNEEEVVKMIESISAK